MTYTVKEIIYQQDKTTIARVYDELGKFFIAKYPTSELPSQEFLNSFKQEFDILTSLKHISQIIEVKEITPFKNGVALILEDTQSQSVANLIKQKNIQFPDKLKITQDICHALCAIHKKNIIHKDLNPANIIYNVHQKTAQLIDFGIATLLPRSYQEIKAPESLNGTLSYIAPEQTGRMNRGIDARSDLYSFGCSLYEIFTEQLPFNEIDAMALVHAHLAKKPIPPHVINSSLPSILSNIILKLMNKNADDRYQSSASLLYDIEKICDAHTKRIPLNTLCFDLATQDNQDKLIIPSKLYGREKEQIKLIEIFEQASLGQPQLLLIDGYSGAGKSALVNDIHKKMTEKRGYFISGKFDQTKKNIPYYAFLQIFNDLFKQLMSLSTEALEQWMEPIIKTLNKTGHALFELIPALKKIIHFDETEQSHELDSKQVEHRFNYAMQQFFSLLCTKEHPLIVFIDDWQWCDYSSIKLLRLLLATEKARHLMFIISYRENEIDTAHPFFQFLKDFLPSNFYDSAELHSGQQINDIKNNIETHRINLKTLSKENVTQLIQDTLNQDNVSDITDIVYQKTHGNPFSIHQTLRSLYEKKIIYYVQEKHAFSWQKEALRHVQISDNVIDIILERIEKIPIQTKEILQIAACIGNSFKIDTLLSVCEKTKEEIFPLLVEIIKEDFIQVLDEQFLNLKFTHDRIQQSFYLSLLEISKQQIHFKIGRFLLAQQKTKDRYENIFEIIGHLSKGRPLIKEEQDIFNLSSLYTHAAAQAKENGAYQESLQLCLTAESCLEEIALFNHLEKNQLKLRLSVIMADTALYTNQYELMIRACEFLEQQADPLIVAHAAKVKICYFNVSANYQKSVDIGFNHLKKIGINIPKNPSKIRIIFDLLYTLIVLFLFGNKKLHQKPTNHQPFSTCGIFLGDLIISASIAAPLAYPILIFFGMRQSVIHGISSSTPITLCSFSVINAAVFGNIKEAVKFRNIAENLARSYYPIHITSVHITSFLFIDFRHSSSVLKTCKEAQEHIIRGFELGNQESAGYLINARVYSLLFSEASLTYMKEEFAVLMTQIKKTNQEYTLISMQIALQAIEDLSNLQCKNFDTITGVYADAQIIEKKLREDKNMNTGLFLFSLIKSWMQYLQGNENNIESYFDIMAKHSNAALGSIIETYYHYIHALHMLRYGRVQQALLKKHIQYLKKNKTLMPINFSQKYALVEAEQLRHKKKYRMAEKKYEEAIEQAKKNQHLSDEAMALECTALHYKAQNKTLIAQAYMKEARNAYARWGAMAKVSLLEQQHPDLLSIASFNIERKHENSSTIKTLQTLQTSKTLKNGTLSNAQASQSLDLMSIIKASHALSKEINLKNLMTQMLHIALENAGADKGIFLLKNNKKLYIEGILTPQGIDVLQHLDIEQQEQKNIIPTSIIQYINNNQELIILDTPYEHSMFGKDIYILTQKPQAILCVPIIQQGKTIGILYLENNLTPQAFNKQRVETITLLASQAAISLENVLVYQNLEDKVKERTAKIEKLQEELLKTSREAGKSEVASHILHNAGNALTQVNTSSQILKEKTQSLRIENLEKAILLILEHQNNIEFYLNKDEKGKKILPYIAHAMLSLKSEKACIIKEAETLSSGINHVRDIINTQQMHAKKVIVEQELDLKLLIQETLDREQLLKDAHQIHVEQQLKNIKHRFFKGDKELIIHVLSTILNQHKKNLDNASLENKHIIIQIDESQNNNQQQEFKIQIEDNGETIKDEDRVRIFNYDYAHHPNQFGYGLHHAANNARMMGGSLSLQAPQHHTQGLSFLFTLPTRNTTS